MPFQTSQRGLIVNLHVTPKASKNRIGPVAQGPDGNVVLKVYATAVPDDGKANAAVINLLAKTWKLPKTSLAILRGVTHRQKVLEIIGDPAILKQKIQSYLMELR